MFAAEQGTITFSIFEALSVLPPLGAGRSLANDRRDKINRSF
jgi:hypothetical protein